MARLTLLPWIVLVVALLAGLTRQEGSSLIPDDQTDCQLREDQSVDYIRIDLDNSNRKTGRLCYEQQSSSVVQLQCDWAAFEFKLGIAISAHSDDRRRLSVIKPPHLRNAVPEISLNRQLGCKPSLLPRVLNATYSYLQDQKTPNHQRNMIIKQDGKLYYETAVYLREYLYNDDCRSVNVHDTEIRMSCCADPQPAIITPIVVPPLNVECEIDACKMTRNAQCNCTIINNALQLTVGYDSALDSSTGFHLTGLTAFAEGSSAVDGVVLLPENSVARSAGIALDQCSSRTAARSLNPIQHYASRSFEFSGQHTGKQVYLQCQVQLCAKTEAVKTEARPLCNVQNTVIVPEPAQCHSI